MPCSPEELRRLAELTADDKLGESAVRNVEEHRDAQSWGGAEVRRQMGFFGPARIQRAVWGDEFAAKVLNTVQRALQTGMNVSSKYYKVANEAIADAHGWGKYDPRRLMGISHERNQLLAKALEQTNEAGNFTGPANSMPPEIIAAASRIRREGYNEMFKIAGMNPDKYIQGYRRMIPESPKGLFWDPNPSRVVESFRERLDPEEIRFLAELERRGTLRNPDPTFTAGYQDYVQGLVRAKIVAPAIAQVEKEFVNDFFGVQLIRSKSGRYTTLVNDKPAYEMWLNLRDHLLGVPTNLDRQLTISLKKMAEHFKVGGVDTNSLHQITQMGTNLFYGGVLGSPLGTRPASLVRHAARLINSYAEFGAKDFISGLQVALTPGSWEAAIKRGVVTAPLEGLHEQIDLARGAGRVISGVTSNFLKVFDASDRLYRVATAAMADTRFNRALETNTLGSLRGGREIRDHVISLVKQGQIDRARDEFATHIVSNTEYAYGKGNRPQIFRGALGQAAGLIMAYPLNYAEMYTRLGKRAIQAYRDRTIDEALPLIRQVAVTSAMMYAGSQFLNSDLTSIFLHGALPESMPGLTIPIHGYQAARSTAFWGAGNLFLTGETDFHKKQRMDHYKEFGRDMVNMIPGGLFGSEVAQVVDDPSFRNISKHLGFAPLAEEANAAARERARARLLERRLETPPAIKGMPRE